VEADFTHTTLGRTGFRVHRLGLSASYRPGERCVRAALDAGINLFFLYGFDGQMIRVLRELPAAERDGIVVATGAYNLGIGHTSLRRTLEKRLRQLRTDAIDLFMLLGVLRPGDLSERTLDEMMRLRDEGRVKAIAISCHDRAFLGSLAERGVLDAVMVRYNAAHRGAEELTFPHLVEHDPGVISYTATRWGRLLRRPPAWPAEARIPTAGECYRFALSHPAVHACLMAPTRESELEENLAALRAGPLDPEDLEFMRSFGDEVTRAKRWFM